MSNNSNNKRDDLLTKLKVGAVGAVGVLAVAAGVAVKTHISSASVAYATETTLLTTNNGQDVKISSYVPMIVEETNSDAIYVKTVDEDGKIVQGSVSKDEVNIKKLPKGTRIGEFQFVKTIQPSDVDRPIDVVNIRSTPELDGSYQNLQDSVDIGVVLLANQYVINTDSGYGEDIGGVIVFNEHGIVDIDYGYEKENENINFSNCFQECVYIQNDGQIGDGFVHVHFTQPLETYEKDTTWDENKIQNIKLCTEDGSDFGLPYEVMGSQITVENGTNGILTKGQNGDCYIEFRGKDGRIWSFPMPKGLEGMPDIQYLTPLNPEGESAIADLMSQKDNSNQEEFELTD